MDCRKFKTQERESHRGRGFFLEEQKKRGCAGYPTVVVTGRGSPVPRRRRLPEGKRKYVGRKKKKGSKKTECGMPVVSKIRIKLQLCPLGNRRETPCRKATDSKQKN